MAIQVSFTAVALSFSVLFGSGATLCAATELFPSSSHLESLDSSPVTSDAGSAETSAAASAEPVELADSTELEASTSKLQGERDRGEFGSAARLAQEWLLGYPPDRIDIPPRKDSPAQPAERDAHPTAVRLGQDWLLGVPDRVEEAKRAIASAHGPYPVAVNPQVQRFIDRFTGERRAIIDLWLSRAGRYLDMIHDVLRRNGLPEELAFTAMIESGFNPVAVSRAGAKGLWQFMADTGRRYGLRVDHWIDERLDPEKSTHAAAAYLRDLYRQFGSWLLAQAAYNAGELTVTRAIKGTGSKDFYALARSRFLRQETKEFVPQIQAATVIGRNPGDFGFAVGQSPPIPVETVHVPPSTDLRRVASSTGISTELLRGLNPVLVRGVTPPGMGYELKVPAGSREGVLAAVARSQVADKRNGSRTVRAVGTSGVHVVRPRDTVTSIARQYSVSVGDVLRWNNLERQDRIRPGDRLHVTERATERDRQAVSR